MSMGCSLGFRPPQFSEDLVWLPGWLQQHQAEPFDEHIKETQMPSELAIKGLSSFQGNIGESKDANLLAREEGRYNSCHLFLSGENSSEISFSPSPGNVLHFHLHLSSDGNSQNGTAQLLDSSQKLLESNKVLSVQLAENSVGSKDKTHANMQFSAGGLNLLPLSSVPETVENVYPPSPSNNKEIEGQYEKKFKYRFLKGADVNEAVELSIAASEALVINELVKSESASEALPTASVLEVALLVKQARLNMLEDAFCCPTKETDTCDSLSELDDVAMADAFEDVGLSCSVPDDQHACNSAMSHIKETFLSETDFRDDNGLNCTKLRSQQESFDYISTSKHLENNVEIDLQITNDLPLESLDCERQKKLPHDPLSQESLDCERQKQENPKSFPKLFLDENSFVQKHESKSKLGSQSSMHSVGLPDKANEGILLSQDVRSSSLSFVDPLCSVVPCSISTENASTAQDKNQNEGENSKEDFFQPMPELGMEDLQKTLDQNIELDHGNEQSTNTVNGKGSGFSVRRKFTSLKTYSMLLPNYIPLLERGRLCHNQFQFKYDWGLLSSDQNMSSTKYSDKRGFDDLLCLRSVSKCTAGRNNEDNNEIAINRSLAAEMKNEERNGTAEGVEFLVQPLEKRTSPLVVNQRRFHGLQTSKHSVNNFSGEKHPKPATVPGPVIEHQKIKSLQKIQSECYNSNDKHVFVRKRVHFSEAKDLLPQNKKLQKIQSSHQNCSTARAKRTKLSRPGSRAYGVKRCLTNFCVNVGKRLIFQGVEFLLTGFSSEKEKEIEGLIWKYGGVVLFDIPSPKISRGKRSSICQNLPVILCLKKLKTTKFLYGCAVNTLILKVDWLTDSIAAGSIIPPEKYMILLNRADAMCTSIGKLVHLNNNKYIFERVGIMLHGKHGFYAKFSKIIKHGGGLVFKTLQWLVQSLDNEKIFVGAIIAEDESRVSRHLKHCALEREIPMMPASWIIKSLHSGKLFPIKEKSHSSLLPTNSIPEAPISMDWSEEI
ncbi:hypothetical protein ACJW30_11G140900 [Castanea mollissima]